MGPLFPETPEPGRRHVVVHRGSVERGGLGVKGLAYGLTHRRTMMHVVHPPRSKQEESHDERPRQKETARQEQAAENAQGKKGAEASETGPKIAGALRIWPHKGEPRRQVGRGHSRDTGAGTIEENAALIRAEVMGLVSQRQ